MRKLAPISMTPIALALIGLMHGAAAQTQTQTQTETEAQTLALAIPKEDSANLGVVVVTAQRRKEKLQDVPVSITALSGEALLKADEIKTANDITQFIPNAQAAATDGRTRPRWFLRGIGTNETQASTVSPIGIYNDDVFINNVYLQGFPLFDTERIEVLRGPQGTLWGKNTTGGAIHYVSRKPRFDRDGYGKLAIGSYGEQQVQGGVGGALIDDAVAGRISFYNEKRDGWVPNLATGRKDGAVSDTAIRAQLLFEITPDIEATVLAKKRSLDGDKSPSFYVLDPASTVRNPLYAGPQTGRDSIAQAGQFSEKFDSDGLSARVNAALPGGYELTSITAYDAGTRVLFTGSPIAVDISRSRALSDSQQTTQEVRLASPARERLTWIVGAFYFNEKLFSSSVSRADKVAGASGTSASATATSAFKFDITDFEQKTDSYAFFGSSTYKIDEAFSVTGGLRRSVEKQDYKLSYTAAPSTAAFNANVSQWWLPSAVTALSPALKSQDAHTWSQTTYDGTLAYKVNPNVNTYLRYSHGFRAGGFVVSAANTITQLEPETLNATELGVKTQWDGGRWTFNSALFNYDYKDIIVGVLLPVPGTSTTQQVQENAAKGYARGAEFELAWQPSAQLRVSSSLGVLYTKYSDYSSTASGQTINATGNRFTRAPKGSFTLAAEYRQPLPSGASVGVGGDYSLRSRQYFNAVNQSNSTLSQAGYGLANARVFYATADGRLEGALFVRNLSDTVYSVLATGPSNGVTREVYGLPRSWGGSLTLKF